MIVGICRSPMSFCEWEIDVPALPRPGDHIQLWSHDSDDKTGNFVVKSVMFAGEKKKKRKTSKMGVIVFCDMK